MATLKKVADVDSMNHLSFALRWFSFSVVSDDTGAQHDSPIDIMHVCVRACACVLIILSKRHGLVLME